jgi:hypothetical protein
MLQGRIGKNIFLKHYLTPSADYKAQVLEALGKLQQQLPVLHHHEIKFKVLGFVLFD